MLTNLYILDHNLSKTKVCRLIVVHKHFVFFYLVCFQIISIWWPLFVGQSSGHVITDNESTRWRSAEGAVAAKSLGSCTKTIFEK